MCDEAGMLGAATVEEYEIEPDAVALLRAAVVRAIAEKDANTVDTEPEALPTTKATNEIFSSATSADMIVGAILASSTEPPATPEVSVVSEAREIELAHLSNPEWYCVLGLLQTAYLPTGQKDETRIELISRIREILGFHPVQQDNTKPKMVGIGLREFLFGRAQILEVWNALQQKFPTATLAELPPWFQNKIALKSVMPSDKIPPKRKR